MVYFIIYYHKIWTQIYYKWLKCITIYTNVCRTFRVPCTVKRNLNKCKDAVLSQHCKKPTVEYTRLPSPLKVPGE